MVVKINENYLKLKSSYLFVEVARREAEFTEANPDANIIKMGIGDVTKPLVPAVVKAFLIIAEKALRAVGRGKIGILVGASHDHRSFPSVAFLLISYAKRKRCSTFCSKHI